MAVTASVAVLMMIVQVSSGGKVCREGKLMAAQLKDADVTRPPLRHAICEDVTLTIGISRTPQELEQCYERVCGQLPQKKRASKGAKVWSPYRTWPWLMWQSLVLLSCPLQALAGCLSRVVQALHSTKLALEVLQADSLFGWPSKPLFPRRITHFQSFQEVNKLEIQLAL